MSILYSKIGLGTVQFGTDYGISNDLGKTSLEEVQKIMEYSQKSGIQYLDTAYAYGNAEAILGHFDLTSYKIISKYIPNKTSLSDQFQTSLSRLRVDYFYGYLAHRPLDLIENNMKNWKILSEFKFKGKVKKIGASFNTTDELETVLDSGIKFDIIQVPFNYFDKRFEKAMKHLKSEGCEIHTRSAFLQGLFFCKTKDLSDFFNEVKPCIDRLQRVDDLSSKLLKFVLNKPFVDIVNIGINNMNQLRDNLNKLNGEKSSELPPLDFIIDEKIVMPSLWPK